MACKSYVIKVLDQLEARYFHRLPKVADSPTKTNLDYIPSSLRLRRKKKPMDMLVNKNGQYLRVDEPRR